MYLKKPTAKLHEQWNHVYSCQFIYTFSSTCVCDKGKLCLNMNLFLYSERNNEARLKYKVEKHFVLGEQIVCK
jgi:hypothetical protein